MSWIKKFILHVSSLGLLQKFVVLLLLCSAILLFPPIFDVFLPVSLSSNECWILALVSLTFFSLGIASLTKHIANRDLGLVLLSVIGSIIIINIVANFLLQPVNDTIRLSSEAFSKEEQTLMSKAYENCINLDKSPKYKKLYFGNLPTIQCEGFSTTNYGNDFILRSTWMADHLQSDEVREIWFFGGSTTLSRLTSDKNTIPSVVSQSLYDKGIHTRVINFGMSGLNHAYELNNLITVLREFPTQPDLVVFYDGYNDSVTSVAYGGDHEGIAISTSFYSSFQPHERAFFEFNEFISRNSCLYQRLWGVLKNRKFRLTDMFSVDEAVSHYVNASVLSDILLDAINVQRLYVLQPMTFTRKNINGIELSYATEWGDIGKSVYDGIRANQVDNPNFYDLSNIFDDYSEQMFYDIGHLGDKGNVIVGKKLAELIALELAK